MSYQFTRITNHSLEAIAGLYKSCFNISVSVDELKKKYDTQSFGEEYVGFMAKSGHNEIGGYYGVFPCRMKIEGKNFLVGQSGDTMTSPEHRKKGLFTNLAKETYQLSRDLDFGFVFGFPNENSLPGFQRKLDWKFYGKMQKFTLNNKVGFPLCELASKYNIFKGLYRRLVRLRLKKYIIETGNLNQIENGVDRNSVFFEYKLSMSSDTYIVKVDGFDFIIKTEPHLMIGDVSKFEESELESFVSALKKLSRLTFAKKTDITVSENHWLFPILETRFKNEASLPIGFYQIRSEIDYSTIVFSLVDYDTF